MANHAEDVRHICRESAIDRAAFIGVSIGGYILFEFCRRYSEHVALLVLSNTKAQSDSDEARANRLKAAAEVEKNGTASFLDSMVPKLLGETTRRNRPDIVSRARAMMDAMSREGLAAVQRGMASRSDSVTTMPAIKVPTLIVRGQEDTLIPAQDAELMHNKISGSHLYAMAQSGHYAPLEKPQEFLQVLRPFLDSRTW